MFPSPFVFMMHAPPVVAGSLLMGPQASATLHIHYHLHAANTDDHVMSHSGCLHSTWLGVVKVKMAKAYLICSPEKSGCV